MTFILTDRLIAVHEPGAMTCLAGWCSNSDGTPVPYPHSCGGVVHGDFDRQDESGWFVHTGCDSCGFTEIVHHAPFELFGHEGSDLSVVQTIDPGRTEKSAPAKKTAKRATKKTAKRAPRSR